MFPTPSPGGSVPSQFAKGNPHHECLLLLTPPSSTDFSAIKTEFEPAVSKALTDTASLAKDTRQIPVLDIAVPVAGLQSRSSHPRAKVYPKLQKLLANLFKLVGSIAVSKGIELDVPGGVDVRVFFLDDDVASTKLKVASDVIPSLHDVAVSGRSWDMIYMLGNAKGDAMVTTLLQAMQKEGRPLEQSKMKRVPCSNEETAPLDISARKDDSATGSSGVNYKVAIGGTFDHLHIGHKLLLSALALVTDPAPVNMETYRKLTVGITGDELLKNKKYAEALEPWDRRWKAFWDYLESTIDFRPMRPGDKRDVTWPGSQGPRTVTVRALHDLFIEFVELSDPFGPTITDEAITALVVSGETRAGGKAINDKRREKGWRELDVFEIDVLDLSGENTDASQENFASKISSTEIRRRMLEMEKGNL
ncbi:hypothetical protein KEM55_005501 [Ascosphaera atra]|nr:hypothetical protein KEM55_005501 [Ascosphaera atra]